MWTASVASFLQSHPSAQLYSLGFKAEAETTLSPMPHSHPTWLTSEGGSIPFVRPVEFTLNPIYGKTFWLIYSFLNKPFSLGTIHISSLYPLQGCMGEVYLQKRTRAFLSDLFLKINVEHRYRHG